MCVFVCVCVCVCTVCVYVVLQCDENSVPHQGNMVDHLGIKSTHVSEVVPSNYEEVFLHEPCECVCDHVCVCVHGYVYTCVCAMCARVFANCVHSISSNCISI